MTDRADIPDRALGGERPAPVPRAARAAARLSPLSLLLSLLIFAAPAFAQPAPAAAKPAAAPAAASGTYSVEVIVFRAAGGGDGGASAPLRGGSDSAGATQVARYIGPLPGSRMQLGAVREKLAAGGYRVLVHTGWVQTAASFGSRTGLPLDRLGIRVPGLSGSFMLERGSLLHLGMSLRYAGDGGAAAQLTEIRRIRFNERNYYDHPSLGVIAVVTPGG